MELFIKTIHQRRQMNNLDTKGHEDDMKSRMKEEIELPVIRVNK